MKPLFPALLILSLLPALPAQNVPFDPGGGATATEVRLNRDELKQLAGPIALYPDPLVALVLPASTFPSDIVLAARFVAAGEDPALADEKPWDESIRSLTRYPDVLAWMDENLEWTTQLGYAYLAQPDDVMDAIQDLRAQAESVGNLADTPQQRIVREESYIRIVPSNPEYIYVPYYDPAVIYYERPVSRPLVTFGNRWLAGYWLTYDFDWHRHQLYCGDWRGDWDYGHHRDRHDYRGEPVYINNSFTNYEVWQGDSRRRMGSARAFEENRTRIRQGSIARPQIVTAAQVTQRQERFDKVHRAVAADRQRVGLTKEIKRPGREKVNADGAVVNRNAINADSQTQTGDRGKMYPNVKPGDRGKVGADSPVVGRNPTIDESLPRDRSKMGQDGKDGKGGDRGKGRVVVPGQAAPAIAEDGRGPGKGNPDKFDGKGKGPNGGDPRADMRGDASKDGRGGPNGRPDVNGTGIPQVDRLAPGISDDGKSKGKGKGLDHGDATKDARSGPSGRPDVNGTGIPQVTTPAPTIGEDAKSQGKGKGNSKNDDAQPGNRSRHDDDGKGKGATPKARIDGGQPGAVSPQVIPGDQKPKFTPKAEQNVPKVRPAPSVIQTPPSSNVAPPERKVEHKSKESSSAPIQEKKIVPQQQKSVAPPVARQEAPKHSPPVAMQKKIDAPKHEAPAPRKEPPAPKPVASAPPPQAAAAAAAPAKKGDNKKSDEDDPKKKKH